MAGSARCLQQGRHEVFVGLVFVSALIGVFVVSFTTLKPEPWTRRALSGARHAVACHPPPSPSPTQGQRSSSQQSCLGKEENKQVAAASLVLSLTGSFAAALSGFHYAPTTVQATARKRNDDGGGSGGGGGGGGGGDDDDNDAPPHQRGNYQQRHHDQLELQQVQCRVVKAHWRASEETTRKGTGHGAAHSGRVDNHASGRGGAEDVGRRLWILVTVWTWFFITDV